MDRVLLFIKVPPPITGATLMNNRVYESELLKSNFTIRAIRISYMKKLDNMGKWQLSKLLKIIKVTYQLLFELLFCKPRFVYFQISLHGYAFYRDLVYITLIKLFQVKILYHLHGKGIKEHVKNKYSRKLYTYAFNGSEVICLSSLLVFDIYDVFNGKIHVVNNGIPDIDFGLVKQSQEMKNDIVEILFLSNLIKSKGIYVFIKAMKILKEKGILFSANIVGDEAEISSKELSDLILFYNLENTVVYLGSRYGFDKYKVFIQSQIFVFPTENDIWGNVIVEAMQFSVPVIATIEGAIPEIIDDGVTGYLVEKDSPEQIAEKLQVLIQYPILRNSMGKAGRKKYEEKYTIRKFEENLLNVFNNVINSTVHFSEIKQNELKQEL